MTTMVGIIGGSGLYEIAALADRREVAVDTPFGNPSDAYILGKLSGVEVAFLPRHGRGHRLTPSELNFRANIYGFKKMGVTQIISVTAVGSLKEHIRPLDLVIPDQFYDRTRMRHSTFFGEGLVAHVAFADPICPHLAGLLYDSGVAAGATVHKGASLVCIEGPAFSTRVETDIYRRLGMDIIGMTTVQEAKLSREAEICFAALALVTDYDCWHTAQSEVSVDAVVKNLNRNISVAKNIVQTTVPLLTQGRECGCASALADAIMTDPSAIPRQTREKLDIIVGKYLKKK